MIISAAWVPGVYESFLFELFSSVMNCYAWSRRITKVGTDLQTHPVQPSTVTNISHLNHVPQYNIKMLLEHGWSLFPMKLFK